MNDQHPGRNLPSPAMMHGAVPDLTTEQLVQTTYTLLATQVKTLTADVDRVVAVLAQIHTQVTTMLDKLDHVLDPTEPRVPALPWLTPRQIAILRKVAEGKSNRVIAQEMWMGQGTVKGDLGQAMQELDVHTRAHAAVKAQQLGLLDTVEPPTASGPHHPW